VFVSRVRSGLAGALLVCTLAGCAHPGARAGPGDDPETDALAAAIAELDASVDPAEARAAANAAVAGARELADAYRMTWPPLLHNALVNTGILERGLCCHWAEDLSQRLRALDLQTLDVHWVVAHHGSLLREHNSPLLAARGQRFENGLVLDGWRKSGALVWAPVASDRYPWRRHPLDGEWERLHCD